MSKIPFDIKYRPQIESGEYKVEAKYGGPVEIVKWDLNSPHDIAPILTIIHRDYDYVRTYSYEGYSTVDSDRLFIVTPEPELSEFEHAFGLAIVDAPEPEEKEEWYPYIKEKAAELLDLARKEALKDLPRWKRIRDNGCVDADGDTYTDCLCLLKRGWYQVISAGTKVGGEIQYLSVSDLEKLPGFKED